MGRERQARLERKEFRAEIQKKQVNRRRILMPLISLLLVGGVIGSALILKNNQDNQTPKTMYQATIKTSKGDIKVELYKEAAPKTVDNFVKLAREDFYNGTTFHRVIEDFMIQGGDPNSKDDDPDNDGQGGPDYTFEDEINPRSLGLSDQQIQELEDKGYTYNYDLKSYKVDVGALAMANSGPNTNGSQFFIVTKEAQPHLDGLHTVFGHVLEGMDVVLKIRQRDKIKGVEITETTS